MQKIKIPGVLLGLCLLLGLAGSGCSPSGPRVLKEGREYLARGNTPAAIECFQKAVRMMPTNALAYAHLGLALQKAGRTTNAIACCQQALLRDRDLTEVHYNLGCLWLDAGDAESAKSEFTAFTFHQPKVIDGWLKLGAAHLRSRDPKSAESAELSFAEALRLEEHCGEAWNGLGLARVKRHRYGEAADYFASAIRQQPGYAPAILNLAVVYHQYIRNKPAALQTYKDYLALTPRPADADAVLRVARTLERELAPPPPQSAVTNVSMATSQPVTPAPRSPSSASTTTSASAAHPPTTGAVAAASAPAKPAPAPALVTPRTPPPPRPVQIPTGALEVVRVVEPVELRSTPDTNPPTPPARPATEASTAPVAPVETHETSATPEPSPVPARKGFFAKLNPMNLFKSEGKKGSSPAKTPTPLPPAKKHTPAATPQPVVPSAPAGAAPPAPAPAAPPPAPVRVPRYSYAAAPKPVPGNRAGAAMWFDKALQHHASQQLDLAVTEYRQALTNDPSYFEAAYNMTLALKSLGLAPQTLKASETALAIRPESVDAQFNFALALRDNGYWLDAAAELEKMLIANDSDARAHLALGKLLDEKLRRPADARLHYLKVVELDPKNPNIQAIREWLIAHPAR